MRWLPRFLARKLQIEVHHDSYDNAESADVSVVEGDYERQGALRVAEESVSRAAGHIGFSASPNPLLHNRNGLSGPGNFRRLPFIPSQPVSSPQRLAGRAELLQRVVRSIEIQYLHVVLYGDRGVGKTSLLKVVQYLAAEAGYIVQYVSCGQSASFCEIFRSLAQSIPLLYDGTTDPTEGSAVVGGTLADRLPVGNYSVSQLTDVFSVIDGARVILILDEFDRSEVEGFRRSVGELIKNLSDRSIPLHLVIGGVASNLTNLISYLPSIRRNIVGIGVPSLNSEEVDEMIDIGEDYGNARFDVAARERLCELSAGLPYLVGLLGQHAAMAAADWGDNWVGRSHVDTALAAGCEDIASRLSLRCSFALEQMNGTPDGELVLRAASEAATNGGAIIDPVTVAALTAQCGAVQELLMPIEDDPRGGWVFREDGASSLVWLRSFL